MQSIKRTKNISIKWEEYQTMPAFEKPNCWKKTLLFTLLGLGIIQAIVYTVLVEVGLYASFITLVFLTVVSWVVVDKIGDEIFTHSDNKMSRIEIIEFGRTKFPY